MSVSADLELQHDSSGSVWSDGSSCSPWGGPLMLEDDGTIWRDAVVCTSVGTSGILPPRHWISEQGTCQPVDGCTVFRVTIYLPREDGSFDRVRPVPRARPTLRRVCGVPLSMGLRCGIVVNDDKTWRWPPSSAACPPASGSSCVAPFLVWGVEVLR